MFESFTRTRKRNIEIYNMYASGHYTEEIVLVYGLSTTRVRQIICDMKKEIKKNKR